MKPGISARDPGLARLTIRNSKPTFDNDGHYTRDYLVIPWMMISTKSGPVWFATSLAKQTFTKKRLIEFARMYEPGSQVKTGPLPLPAINETPPKHRG
ncbi:hypothetical protein [Bradyrhizobium sp. McL0616]|uniref:hypothetical protein n=1 Tax=Bradyrhizobium sp. McL0616 TaxID=3415674 RepID=UPI003CF2B6D2